MGISRLLLHLQQCLPKLMAVYAFGSRFEKAGSLAHANSDLDLAVLVEAYSDPVTLFELASELADITHLSVRFSRRAFRSGDVE
jgi:predicted nucleotidyltransferase